MQLTMDEKLVSQTAPISKTRIGTGRIISGLLVPHVGIYEKQSRDRQEAPPRTRELAALVVSLPPGRGSATFLKRLHIYVAHRTARVSWSSELRRIHHDDTNAAA
jgi:hypothetical protein